MSNDYFNRYEFMQAQSLFDTNPLESKLRFEKYLQKYPKDYCTYPYYITVLITLGEFDAAEKVLNFIKNKYKKDGSFNTKSSKVKILTKNIFFNELKLLCYQEKYDKLYDLYFNNYDNINDIASARFDLYIKKKAGKLDFNHVNIKTYIHDQILEYSEILFLEHIKKHQADYNQNIDNPNKNIFVPNFPINDVIQEVKKYIMSDKRLYPGFIENTYYFKYDECGRDNDKLVDYFKVSCFNNTTNFITMFPLAGCEHLTYVDLNYLVSKKEEKVKKKSN